MFVGPVSRMPYDVKQNLILLAVFYNAFKPIRMQFPMPVYMPMPMPQPVFAMPAPMPIVAIKMPSRKKITTTTTTTTTPEPEYAIAVPVPVPMPMPPMPFAVPAQPPPTFCQAQPRPKSCPPCPPCICLPACTPAFFSYCSPCHQKCRCRNPADAPAPLPPMAPAPAPLFPVPMVPAPMGPPPVVVVPQPPIMQRPDCTSSESSPSDSCDSSDRYYRSYRKPRRRIKFLKRKYRRDAGEDTDENTAPFKPVLSYVSENGDVKFETQLSDQDAMEILNKEKTKYDDQPTKENTVVVTKDKQTSGRRYNKVLLQNSPTNPKLNKGNNEFIFKPSLNKKIDSVALSFQVS